MRLTRFIFIENSYLLENILIKDYNQTYCKYKHRLGLTILSYNFIKNKEIIFVVP